MKDVNKPRRNQTTHFGPRKEKKKDRGIRGGGGGDCSCVAQATPPLLIYVYTHVMGAWEVSREMTGEVVY